jgi:hypothetical protein
MKQINKEKYSDYLDFGLSLDELIKIIFVHKYTIISLTSLVSILAVIFSLSLPNIYQSKASLAPSEQSSNLFSSLSSYSGIASLASIDLPSSSDGSNTERAIEKLYSLSFFEENIMPKIYLPDLMALKSWDPLTNEIYYNEKLFDVSSNAWVRKYSYPKKQIPSPQESFKIFKDQHFAISRDKKTGFVYLSMKHQSPYLAREWLDLVVNEINAFYREKNRLESERAVQYLNNKILSTNFSEVKAAIAQLIQDETKKLAVIETSESYVFDYIDPPKIMELKSDPKRAIICIISALIGGLLSVCYVLVRHYFKENR